MEMEFILALIMGASLGGAAGYLGTLMLSQRMALVAGPLGHLTLPGIALAMILGFDVSLGAFPFVILGIIFIWLFEMRTGLPMEAVTAVVFAAGVAITFLFLPEEKAVPALIGDISQITLLATIIVTILSLTIFFMTKKIYSKMILAGISEDLAKVHGANFKKYNLIYLLSIALTVALGVRIMGGLMTAALVAIPASTARNMSKGLFQYSYGGLILGGLACILGIFGFRFTSLPAGPLIAIVGTFFFLVSLAFKRCFVAYLHWKYPWMFCSTKNWLRFTINVYRTKIGRLANCSEKELVLGMEAARSAYFQGGLGCIYLLR
jgi:ABC-type Mn2+/Zn2+ transport system permease subunit